MLQSMTGYGRAIAEDEHARISIEVKSLNAKQADVSMFVPKMCADQELAWKNLVIKHLERGRIVLTINYENKQPAIAQVRLNKPLFKAYYHRLHALAEEVGASTTALFQIALQAPEVTPQVEASMADQSATQTIAATIEAAIQACKLTRQEEGRLLAQSMATYAQHIGQNLADLEALDAKRMQAIRIKLVDKLSPLQAKLPIDENRLEQELIYYIERLDITEEKVRLAKHLAYFEEVMHHQAAVGKKLGFIAQEIGREINTIGAKANDAALQKHVILMKEELEKIKEQLQNIL